MTRKLTWAFIVFYICIYTHAIAYSPVSGFIYAKRLYQHPCIASADYQVTVTINFSNNQIPDSISIIHDQKVLVPFLNVEKICNNLFTATYQVIIGNQGCKILNISAIIDSNTFFSGPNIQGEKLFRITYILFDGGGRTYVGIDPPDLLMHGNYELEKGRDFTFIPFKINTTTGTLTYKLFSDTSKIYYPFTVKVNPQNGMMHISQLTDTGVYQLIFTVKEQGLIDIRIQREGFYYITLHVKEQTAGNIITSATNKVLSLDSSYLPYFITGDNDTLRLNLQFKQHNRASGSSLEDNHEIFYNPDAYTLVKKNQMVSNDTLTLDMEFLIRPTFHQLISNPITVEMRSYSNDTLCQTYSSYALYGRSSLHIGMNQLSGEIKTPVIYPNPVSEYLQILPCPNNLVSVRAIDGTGKVVYLTMGENNTIDVRNLSPGIFILLLEGEKQTFTTRFIKL